MNLYELSIEGVEVTTFCGGNLGGEHETCFTATAIPGTTEGYALRGNKPEDEGHELRGTASELDAFARGWVKMRGLKL